MPLFLLLIFLGIGVGYQFFLLIKERMAIQARIQQVAPQTEAAIGAKKRLYQLASDIDQLAPKDAAAAQIVNDFKIHAQAPQKDTTPAGK